MATEPTGFTVDLRRYKDRQGSRLPEGDYRVEVFDAEVTKTKAGDPMVTVFLKVANGTQQGKTLVDRLTLKDSTLWRVVAFLKAVNIPTPNKQIDIQLRALIGKQLIVTVEDGEPYPAGSSNIRSEIRGYAPIAGPAKKTEVVLEDEDDEGLEDTEEVEEDEEEAPPPAKRRKPAPEPAEDDDYDDDEDGVEL